MPDGGVPRELHDSLIFAAAAANAWLRGLSLPTVALSYRYEPVTALNLIWRCCRSYGVANVAQFVPANVLAQARPFGSEDPVRRAPSRS
jgi:hypothetical protein